MCLAHWPALEQPGKTPREAVLWIGTPLLLAAAVRSGRSPRWASALLFLPVASGMAGVLTGGAAERAAITRDLALLAAPWLVFLGASRLGSDRCRERGTFRAIEIGAMIALAAAGAIGLAQAWFGFEGLPQARAPASTFVNRNVATQALAPILPWALLGLARGRPAWERWLASGAVGLGLAFIIATRTRGGWLGLLVGVVVGGAAYGMRVRRGRPGIPRPAWAPTAVATLLAGLAIIVPIHDDGAGGSVATLRSGFGSSWRSAEVRLSLWRNTLALLGDHPWAGVGAGRFQVEYPPYRAAVVPTLDFKLEQQPERAHNDLLEYAVELGAPAAAAAYAVLVAALVLACIRVRDSGSEMEASRSAALAVALTAGLTHSLVSFPLHSPASAFAIWLAAGLAVAPASGRVAPRRIHSVVFVSLLCTAAIGGLVGAREIMGQKALMLGTREAQSRRCDAAVDQAELASRRAPWRRKDRGLAALLHFHCDPDAESALKVIESALALQPHQLNLLLAAGYRRLDLGRPAEAEAAFRHALAIHDGIAQTWLGLARAAHARHDRATAIDACREAGRLDPEFQPALLFCRQNRYLR